MRDAFGGHILRGIRHMVGKLGRSWTTFCKRVGNVVLKQVSFYVISKMWIYASWDMMMLPYLPCGRWSTSNAMRSSFKANQVLGTPWPKKLFREVGKNIVDLFNVSFTHDVLRKSMLAQPSRPFGSFWHNRSIEALCEFVIAHADFASSWCSLGGLL